MFKVPLNSSKLISTVLVGHFFIDGNLNSEKFLLITLCLPFEICSVKQLMLSGSNKMVHYWHQVREYLNNTFPNRWIRRRGIMKITFSKDTWKQMFMQLNQHTPRMFKIKFHKYLYRFWTLHMLSSLPDYWGISVLHLLH